MARQGKLGLAARAPTSLYPSIAVHGAASRDDVPRFNDGDSHAFRNPLAPSGGSDRCRQCVRKDRGRIVRGDCQDRGGQRSPHLWRLLQRPIQGPGPIFCRSTPSYPSSSSPIRPERMPPTSPWSSTPWTCFTAAGSTDFVWYRQTAILRDWPPASGNTGVDVYGFGEQKTPESFRQACRRFVYTENLPGGMTNNQDAAAKSQPLQPLDAATPIIKKVIAQMESEDGWVGLGEVGKGLTNLAPDFDFQDLRLPQAERPRAKDKRFRDRAAESRRNHAYQDQARCRIASEDASRPQACGLRHDPDQASPSLPAWQRSAFGTRRLVG